jgi:hypothetical protein
LQGEMAVRATQCMPNRVVQGMVHVVQDSLTRGARLYRARHALDR